MTYPEHARLAEWPARLDIPAIHREYGSPAWIVSEDCLKENVALFEIFTGHPGRIYYPVKTNPSLAVLQILASLGAGADCAGGPEIDLALFAGIRMENISYNSPVQDVRLCRDLLLAGARVVMDDPVALAELQAETGHDAFPGKLFLRINLPDYVGYARSGENQDLMAHGHRSSKFGIPAEEARNVLAALRLPVSGLHVHVGTQMDNMESFEHALTGLHQLAHSLRKDGHAVTEINIGGGLGIPFGPDDTFPSVGFWSTRLAGMREEGFHYCAEPGHALVGNAVALLTEVQTIKNSRGKKWAVVDTGTDQLAKVTLLKWPHRILDKTGTALRPGADAVAGPLCFAGDTLLDHISLENLERGSPLLIAEAGAYTYSLSNRFNGRLAPAWLVLTSGGRLLQTAGRESRHDNPQYATFGWGAVSGLAPGEPDPTEALATLSSAYLRETSMQDEYGYLRIERLQENKYRFTVSTRSAVGFVSMPFAIRIFGDAAIISALHRAGHATKDVAVWGRKLTLDCFGQVASNTPLTFDLEMSGEHRRGGKTTVSTRFHTSCGKCAGSLTVTFGA